MKPDPGEALPEWIQALDQEIFGTPWGPLESHERLFSEAPLAYARWSAVPAAGEGELLRIAVAPTARRQGHARALLLASEKALRAEGITELFLEVRISNAPARALYEAMGWRPQGLRKRYYRDGEDAATYSKHLLSDPEADF